MCIWEWRNKGRIALGLGKHAMWSMKADRKLIELAKTETLEVIADQFQLPPRSILKKAAKLGLTIKRKGKTKAGGLSPFQEREMRKGK
jgi:hypothetical protein